MEAVREIEVEIEAHTAGLRARVERIESLIACPNDETHVAPIGGRCPRCDTPT